MKKMSPKEIDARRKILGKNRAIVNMCDDGTNTKGEIAGDHQGLFNIFTAIAQDPQMLSLMVAVCSRAMIGSMLSPQLRRKRRRDRHLWHEGHPPKLNATR